MQSASYQAESGLIISSIKAEISLKINATASYCLLCTLVDGAAKSDKEEQSALPLMLWMKCRIFVCMDLVISWGSLCYSTPPSAPLSCSGWNRHCDVYVIIFLPPQEVTLGSTSLVGPEEPSLCLCNFYQTARSGGRGQRAGSLSQRPSNPFFYKGICLKTSPGRELQSEGIISQDKKGTATLLPKEKWEKFWEGL